MCKEWIKTARQESPDVRVCVLEMPLVRTVFVNLVLWAKYKVLAVTKPGFSPAPVAAALADILQAAAEAARHRGDSSVVGTWGRDTGCTARGSPDRKLYTMYGRT